MLKFAKVAFLMAGLCLLAAGVFAQAPNTLTYQGKLTDNALDAVDYPVDVTFNIYASEDVEDVSLWTEVHVGLTPNELGIFTVELGAIAPFTPDVFDGSVRYLGITVGTDDEMVPRQKITSAPYSMQSNTPGVAHSYRSSYAGTASYVDLDTLTVTVPGPGYLMVRADCRTLVSVTNVYGQYLLISISTTPTTYYSAASGVHRVDPTHLSSASSESTMAAVRLEPVTAGEYTFYLNGRKGHDNTSATMYYIHFSAQYIPAWIGSDAPPVLTAAGMASEHESTDGVPTPGSPEGRNR